MASDSPDASGPTSHAACIGRSSSQMMTRWFSVRGSPTMRATNVPMLFRSVRSTGAVPGTMAV